MEMYRWWWRKQTLSNTSSSSQLSSHREWHTVRYLTYKIKMYIYDDTFYKNVLNICLCRLTLTDRGKPRTEKITIAATLNVLLPPITCWICLESLLIDSKLKTVVAAIQIKTVKLLIAHTNFGPIFRHIGSTKKEPTPRTICWK